MKRASRICAQHLLQEGIQGRVFLGEPQCTFLTQRRQGHSRVPAVASNNSQYARMLSCQEVSAHYSLQKMTFLLTKHYCPRTKCCLVEISSFLTENCQYGILLRGMHCPSLVQTLIPLWEDLIHVIIRPTVHIFTT